MSRYIDADVLIMALRLEYPMMPMFKENQREWEIKTDGYRKAEEVIKDAPSIDIVRCKECKWVRYCETEDLDLYLDCDKPDGGGIPRSEDWFCADGEREGE